MIASVLAYALVGILVQVLVTVLLHLWARWVARRQGGTWWRRATWLPWTGLGLSIVGLIVSTVSLARAFEAVETADASIRATLLASSISEAMNSSALFALPSWLLYITSVLVSAAGTISRSSRPTVVRK